jgi:hypothetical protein
MIEHPQSGADERRHLEQFLHTSAEYFGLIAAPRHGTRAVGDDPSATRCPQRRSSRSMAEAAS